MPEYKCSLHKLKNYSTSVQFIERIVVISPGSTTRLIRGDFWLSFDTIAAIKKKVQRSERS